MKPIDESLRIYSMGAQELTFGQIRTGLTGFSDKDRVQDFLWIYDKEEDRLLCNADMNEEYLAIARKALTGTPEISLRNLANLKAEFICPRNKAAMDILQGAVLERMKKQANDTNPNTRFLCIGDDIFQISKIVSVRCRDEGNRSLLEVFVTNRQASVRKEFPLKHIRDAEFARIKKVLGQTA